MTVPTLLALLTVVVAMPLNWFVTFRLWRLYRGSPELGVLRERALASLFVAIVVTIFALVFLNNDLTPPMLAFDDTKLVTRGAMLAVGIVPAGYWLWLYR